MQRSGQEMTIEALSIWCPPQYLEPGHLDGAHYQDTMQSFALDLAQSCEIAANDPAWSSSFNLAHRHFSHCIRRGLALTRIWEVAAVAPNLHGGFSAYFGCIILHHVLHGDVLILPGLMQQ